MSPLDSHESFACCVIRCLRLNTALLALQEMYIVSALVSFTGSHSGHLREGGFR